MVDRVKAQAACVLSVACLLVCALLLVVPAPLAAQSEVAPAPLDDLPVPPEPESQQLDATTTTFATAAQATTTTQSVSAIVRDNVVEHTGDIISVIGVMFGVFLALGVLALGLRAVYRAIMRVMGAST